MTAISVPLNLSDIIVINTNVLINHDRVVHVVSTELGTDCKQCGQYITQYHSLNKTVLLNHLPAFGIPVYIKFQPIRYECMDCKSTTTQKPPWYQSVGHCTQLYAQHILDLLVNSTIQEVAQQENISYKRVINIIKKQVPHEIDWSTVEPIKDLGIDEIALKKGHKDFVVIVGFLLKAGQKAELAAVFLYHELMTKKTEKYRPYGWLAKTLSVKSARTASKVFEHWQPDSISARAALIDT